MKDGNERRRDLKGRSDAAGDEARTTHGLKQREALMAAGAV